MRKAPGSTRASTMPTRIASRCRSGCFGRMLIPIGPVAVFAASNFPLAFSVPRRRHRIGSGRRMPSGRQGPPRASGHVGTCRRRDQPSPFDNSICRPAFSASCTEPTTRLRSAWFKTSTSPRRFPHLKKNTKTGSLRGGRGLIRRRRSRPKPIPVFAEMGKRESVFILPGALAERKESLAQGLKQSITAGVGQFCTKPGVVVGLAGDPFTKLSESLSQLLQTGPRRGIAAWQHS